MIKRNAVIDRSAKATGFLLIASGLLLCVGQLIIASLPQVPTASAAISEWAQSHKTPLMLGDEILFFAAIALLSSTILLYSIAKKRFPVAATLFASTFSLAAVMLVIAALFLGRLVYPVNGIDLAGDAHSFASIFYGAMHAAQLLLAVGLISASFATHRLRQMKWIPMTGFVVGILQIAGTYYSGVTPKWLISVAALGFLAWAVAVGIWLIRRAPDINLRKKGAV